MAIKSYLQNDKKLFIAYVNLRSRHDSTVRKQRKTKGLLSESAAKREEKRLLRLVTEEISRKEGRGLTWKEVILKWELDAKSSRFKDYSPLTIRDYVAALFNWTSPWFNILAAELTIADSRDIFDIMSQKGRTVTYQKKIKNLISNIFDWGVENRHIRGNVLNPVRKIRFEKQNEVLPEILSLQQIKKLLDTGKQLEHPWYPIWVMALLTGMRSGELYALDWGSVDFERSMIRVHRSFNGRLKSIGPTKGRYWRNVPISPDLERFLKELKLKKGSDKKSVLPRFQDWRHGNQAAILRAFCKTSGMPSVKFHTLRACFATQLLELGISQAQIMKICGWKELKTMERYIRLAGVSEKGVTDKLDILPTDSEVMDKVINLYDFKSSRA